MPEERARRRSARFAVCLTAMLLGLLALPAFASAATFRVDSDDPASNPDPIDNPVAVDCGTISNPCDTIQRGVTEADQFAGDPSDIVLVLPGDEFNTKYTENVTVPNTEPDLQIRGPKFGLDATTRSSSSDIETDAIVDPDPGEAGFFVNATGVTIDGFAFEGSADAPAISFQALNGQASNNLIRDNRSGVEAKVTGQTIRNNNFISNNLAGAHSGDAIFADSAGVADLEIFENRFDDNNTSAAQLVAPSGTYNNVDISDNEVLSQSNSAFRVNGLASGSSIDDNRIRLRAGTPCSSVAPTLSKSSAT